MKQEVPTLASLFAEGKKASVVFWVGCAGSFDDRAKKITKAFVKIMNHTKTSFAVLGTEESCTGDPAKRAGNEFLFQTQALQNITALDKYGVTKIVTSRIPFADIFFLSFIDLESSSTAIFPST